MKYEDIRNDIKHGDIISVYHGGIFATIIRFVQKIAGFGELSGVTHNGVAWWLQGRLYCIEMNGVNNVLRPMSHYIGCKLLVHECPVPRASMAALFAQETERPYTYSLADVLRIGVRLILKSGRGFGDADEAVCSTFVASWLRHAGWVPSVDFPDMPSPAEIASALKQQTSCMEIDP